jgi:3-hydroxybutyryl-CoA dehydrogenase
MSDIELVGVVGCGSMGSGFAEVCARAGLDVVVAVRSEAAADRGRRRVLASLDRARDKGKLSQADHAAAWRRIAFATEPKALRDRQFVLEAVQERLPDKLQIFGDLDAVVADRDAVLATCTSSLSIRKLGAATDDPGRVIGTHFFNPLPLMPLVELISTEQTRSAVFDRAKVFVMDTLGKQTISVRDRAGFVVNALLVPYLLSAIRMVESGVATVEEVDKGMTLGCRHPMGPLALIDLIGLDTTAAISTAMYEQFKEPLYAPPPLLLRMIEGGLLGRKTGQGFHHYP